METPDHNKNCTCQEIYDAYVAIFDPINSKGTWNSTVQQNDLEQYQRTDSEQEIASKHYEHFVAHAHLDPRTGGYRVRDLAIGCHEPCFFRTPEEYRGFCAPMAQHNDIIVVLEGGKVPYLLRPQPQTGTGDGTTIVASSQQYIFIGECFLQGLCTVEQLMSRKTGMTLSHVGSLNWSKGFWAVLMIPMYELSL